MLPASTRSASSREAAPAGNQAPFRHVLQLTAADQVHACLRSKSHLGYAPVPVVVTPACRVCLLLVLCVLLSWLLLGKLPVDT